MRKRRGQLPPPRPLDMPIDLRSWDRRAIGIGVVATLLFHLLFFVAMPRSLIVLDPLDPDAGRLGEDLAIELTEETPEEQPPRPRYVETNPEAPENEPDKTENFSARNQQAANETVPEELSKDKTPAREGEDDVPFDKAFTGSLDQTPAFQPTPATREQQPLQGQPGSDQPMAQNPPSGFDETRNDDPDGLASSIAKPLPNPKPDAKATEGSAASPRVTLASGMPSRTLLEKMQHSEKMVWPTPSSPNPRQSVG
ncbi:MAG: hypothetical protein IAE82_17505, partial [Opitutaceae bacterium]|nr:hypothetical protein [Opitutaceae bacterium]